MIARTAKSPVASVLRGVVNIQIHGLLKKGTVVKLLATFVVVFLITAISNRLGNSRDYWEFASYAFALGFLPLLCLVKGGEALRNELGDGTIEYLWTRPASKVALFAGFSISSVISVFLYTAVCVLGILTYGVLRGTVESFGQILVYLLGVSVLTVGYSSIAAFLGTVTSKYRVFGILYFGFVEQLIGNIPTSIQNIALSSHGRSIFAAILRPEYFGGLEIIQACLAILLIAAVSLGLGAVCFSRFQYAVGSD